ncbi:MAG: hypothetical protein ACMXX5_02200 [Candidatus Woesearchaeota archaeon]
MCIKKLNKWADKKIKKLNCCDMQCIKIAVIGFTLMIAKLWEPILALNWYWYGLIMVLASIKPIVKMIKD